MNGYFNYKDELMHHGVLGMKWGVRRYQSYSTVPRESGKRGKEIGDAKLSRKEIKKLSKAIRKRKGQESDNAVNEIKKYISNEQKERLKNAKKKYMNEIKKERSLAKQGKYDEVDKQITKTYKAWENALNEGKSISKEILGKYGNKTVKENKNGNPLSPKFKVYERVAYSILEDMQLPRD